MSDTPPQRQKVIFDKTINLGHILTLIFLIASGLGVWTMLDKRVVVLEEARNHQRAVDANQDQRTNEAFQALKEAITRLDRQVERLAERIDKLSSKP